MSSMQLFKKNNMFSWLKIFLPHSKLMYYPPVFIARNPVMASVKASIKGGYEVAVLSFYIKNYKDLTEKLGTRGLESYFTTLKMEFLTCMKETFKDDLLILHDYQSEGLTAILRLDTSRNSLEELDVKSLKVEHCLEVKMKESYPDIKTLFNTGYMFVEKKHNEISEAVNKAHQQALSMAEKKVQSKYNQMLFDMAQIVNKEDIHLLVQPIVDVASNQMVAYEVLTRGPKNTDFESPLNLFSFARQTGKLYELEMIVLEKALKQMVRMNTKKNVFINFTPISVGNAGFVSDVKRLLNRYKTVCASQIVIEITERDSIDELEFLINNIKGLRECGIRIAVDDTGAGYASLHTIIEIMPDIIKIDRSVIKDIDRNTVKESMLKGLLLIAKEIGSTVVAEGIESEKEAMILSKNKVDLAQGYFYARPLNMEKVTVSPLV